MVELCADGRGLAVPPGNPDALADALVVALSSPDRRRSMGQLAREYVSTRYNAMALRRCLLRATFFVPQIAEAPMAGLREFYADHAEGSR
jgi:hypothetical protein